MRAVASPITGALAAIGREAVRIVLPSWCIVCGDELPWRTRKMSCCVPCWSALPKIETVRCRSCALPWSGASSGEFTCIDCSNDPLPVDWCDAWGHYNGKLERLLHALKFERHEFLARPMSELLEERLVERDDFAFDLIAAIPMHPSKERSRGYNQAALIAEALSRRIAIPFHRTLLRKNAEREAQSTLSRAARVANVRGVFSATTHTKESSILLVDDICTTGETLRSAAQVLLRAGAKRVAAITVAKASK
jgi:competence protein ComFC